MVLELKVSLFQNVLLMSSILQKTKQKQFDLKYHSTVSQIRSILEELKTPKGLISKSYDLQTSLLISSSIVEEKEKELT